MTAAARTPAAKRVPAAQSTVDALMYALRRGLGALEDGRNLLRLGELDDAQMRECVIALQKRKPEIGPAVWSRFRKRPKEDTLWYYRELAKAFQELLSGQLADELMEIVIVLENE